MQLSVSLSPIRISTVRTVALSLCAAGAIFASSNAKAEPFFGGSRMSSIGTVQPFYTGARTTRVRTEIALYQPRTEQPVERPEPEEEPAPQQQQVESSGPQPTVSGSRAVLRRGVAYAPSSAPASVKRAIWAVNAIRRKPYKWGGGHGSFSDSGYDCSGSVSFALHHAGVLNSPLPSSDFLRYGERGRGRWVTIYARHGHTFAVIAGLRLDTTDFYRGGDVGPRWYADGRDTWGFSARHPVGL